MSHVFISYSRKDQEFAKQLVADFQAAGLAVWFDQISLAPGEQWDKAIETGLKAAIAVVVVLSPDSMASDNVRNEINFARNNDQRLLPVLYRPTKVILNLESIQWIDISSPGLYQANFKKLMARIAKETTLIPANSLSLGMKTPPPDASLFSGVGVEVGQDELTVASDSRQLSQTQLRRYLRLLGVIASPFATNEGEASKAGYLDISLAWRNLANAIVTAHQLPGKEDNTPYALVRLAPPTPTNLSNALSIDGADAYQIVHLLTHSAEGLLYLEDELGYEAPVDRELIATLFKDSAASLVVSNGRLSDSLVASLLSNTSVQAVIRGNSNPPEEATLLFNSRFYGLLSSGDSVNAAFDATIESLKISHPEVAEGYNLNLRAGVNDVVMAMPDIQHRAAKPLVDTGLPRMQNVPVNLGFVGQTKPLLQVNDFINGSSTRQVAIYGLGGIGKSWLASEYIARFGWRYPDGVLWMHVSEQTKSEDILGQLLSLLEMPVNTSAGTLRNALRNRRVLVVLDQANEWSDPLEVGELADFVARLDTLGGTRFMLTSWFGVEPLTHTSGTRQYVLEEMAPDEAEVLVRRMIAANDLENEFEGIDDGIQRFLQNTLYNPWLIEEGMELVRLDGVETALEELEELTSDVADVLERVVGRQINVLATQSIDALTFLKKLQGVPDSFDRALAEALGGAESRQYLRELMRHNLLRREGKLYSLPSTVRAYLRQHLHLGDEAQDRVDESIIKHLLDKTAVHPLMA